MKNADMPAMPVLEENNIAAGLTKRDEFTKVAMAALLSNSEMIDSVEDYAVDWLVSASVKIAEAQLAELEK